MTTIKNRSRLGLVTAGIAGAALVLSACAPASAPEPAETPAGPAGQNAIFAMLPEAIQEAGVIRAGALFQTPPTIGATADKPDVAVGIVPDLAAAMEPILGVRIEFIDTQWPNQIPGVQSGDLDILWGQLSDNLERERSIFDFVPWLGAGQGLLVAAGNPHGIESYSSMCGLTQAVANGSNTAQIVAAISDELCVGQGKPAIDMIPLQGGADAYAAVKAGTVDAWSDTYSNIVKVADSDAAFEAVRVKMDEIPIEMRNFQGIGVMKANPGLTEALYAALGELRASGEYLAILKRWDTDIDALPDADYRINPFSGLKAGETAS